MEPSISPIIQHLQGHFAFQLTINFRPHRCIQVKLAKDKTEQLYLGSFPGALPDIRKGIRVKAS